MNTIEWIGLISALIGIFSFIWLLYEKRPIKRLSWKIAEKTAKKISDKMIIEGFTPSLIFGIGRGGAIYGSLISGSLGHCPLLVIDRKYQWSEKGRFDEMIFPITIPQKYLTNVLLGAGEAHSGSTMKIYYDFLKTMGAVDLRRAVLFNEEGCTINIEYSGIKSSKKKILMPWMSSERYLRADRQPTKSKEKEFKLKLHLVRHAETSAGEEIFVGTNDYDLTINGIDQASNVGKILYGRNIEDIFTSPLCRAVKTAKIISCYHPNTKIQENKNIREIDFGDWEGLSRSTIKEKYVDTYMNWNEDPVQTIPKNGESPQDVLKRLLSFLKEIEDSYKSCNNIELVAISHKTSIRILLSYLYSEPLNEYRQRSIKNCEIYTLVNNGQGWTIGS